MSTAQSIIGNLLSKHDETAIEGVQKIIDLLAPTNPDSIKTADALASDEQLLSLFPSFFERQCSTASGYRACKALVQATSPAKRSTVLRFLTTKEFFYSCIIRRLRRLSDNQIDSINAALELLSVLLEKAPRKIITKISRTELLRLGVFTAKLNFKSSSVRAHRCLVLALWALCAGPKSESHMILTHGYLTLLMEDAADLCIEKKILSEGDCTEEALAAALNVVKGGLVASDLLSQRQKRDVLMGQRSVIRSLIRCLVPRSSELEKFGKETQDILQDLALELSEEPSDYLTYNTPGVASGTISGEARGGVSVQDEASDFMPNYALFTILRHLRPQTSFRELRVTLFILNLCPDLIRPYYKRIVQHLFEDSKTLSKAAHFSSVTNIVVSVSLGPLPYYLRVPSLMTTLLEDAGGDSGQGRFYAVTPNDLVSEVCPQGVDKFVHSMINSSDNCLHLLLALQITQAMLAKAQLVVDAVRHKFDESANTQKTTVEFTESKTDLDSLSALAAEEDERSRRDAYIAAFEAALRERFPSLEEFWHRLTQQLLPLSVEPKMQYITQRFFSMVHSYSSFFHSRQSWLSAAPAVKPIPGSVVSSSTTASNNTLTSLLDSLTINLLQWKAKSVAALCVLLLQNLTSGIPLVKLHHITLGGGGGDKPGEGAGELSGIVREWPQLLTILIWFLRLDEENESAALRAEARFWVVRLVLWCFYNTSTEFDVQPSEVNLWISFLTIETAPHLLHILNMLLQRRTGRVTGTKREDGTEGAVGAHWPILEAAKQYVSRVVEKNESGKGPGSFWRRQQQKSLSDFQAVCAQVEATWEQREALYDEQVVLPLRSAVLSQRLQLCMQSAQYAGGAMVADVAGMPLEGLVANCLLRRGVNYFALTSAVSEREAVAAVLSPGAGSVIIAAVASLVQKEGLEALLPGGFVFLTARQLAEDVNKEGRLQRDDLLILKNTLLSYCRDSADQLVLLSTIERAGFAAFFAALVYVLSKNAIIEKDDIEFFTHFLTRYCYTATLSVADRGFYAALAILESTEKLNADSQPDKEIRGNEKATDDALRAFISCRFLVGLAEDRFVETSSSDTGDVPEVVALGRVVEQMTQQELLHVAVAMPHTLPGYDLGSRAMSGGKFSLLAAMYGDLNGVADFTLKGFFQKAVPSECTDEFSCTLPGSCIVDPRYILPLLHRVYAIYLARPGTIPSPLVLRTLPFVISGLSCIEPVLRETAALSLALLARGVGGLPKLVLDFIRLKMTRGGEKLALLPRLETFISAFLCFALCPLQNPKHVLHATVANSFVAPLGSETSDVFATGVIPLAHLLTDFPLECISQERIIAQQELLGRSAEDVSGRTEMLRVTEALKNKSQSHLVHILAQLRNSVVTREDFIALCKANVLSTLFLLTSTMQAAPRLRLRIVRVICEICTKGKGVAELAVTRPDARLVNWAVTLCKTLETELAVLSGKEPAANTALRTETACYVLQRAAALASSTRGKLGEGEAERIDSMVRLLMNGPISMTKSINEALKALHNALQ